MQSIDREYKTLVDGYIVVLVRGYVLSLVPNQADMHMSQTSYQFLKAKFKQPLRKWKLSKIVGKK